MIKIKKTIKFILIGLLITGFMMPKATISSGHSENNTKISNIEINNQGIDIGGKNKMRENRFLKNGKTYTEFNEETYGAVYDLTEAAIMSVLRTYDYQKDIPNTKKLVEETRAIIGDNENSRNILTTQLASCATFSKNAYFSFLEARTIYEQSGRRGDYISYIEKILTNGPRRIYKDMEDMNFPYDEENSVRIVKDIFNKLNELTEGETLEENNKYFAKKYIVLEEFLKAMGSPYYDEIVEAEKEIIEKMKQMN